jgi:hypothetical protein
LPWELLWTWNGPDEQGKPGRHFYDASPEARTISGENFIFAPAGELGLFALSKQTGETSWIFSDTGVVASPAYDPRTGHLYIGGSNGLLYKIDVAVGEVTGSYASGYSIEKALLLAGEYVYVVNQAGELHKVHTTQLEAEWVYKAGAPAATPAALSQSHGVIVFADDELYVHAVEQASGSARWQVKPTPHPAGAPYTFSGYWPVVAELSGVVFVRLNLGMGGLWSGPEDGQKYPFSNTETRTYLLENHELRNLFALDLADGSEKFIPAVGYGGVETLVGEDEPELAAGPVPVVRLLPSGQEVAYMFFRSGQVPHTDGRWDSSVGEMVINDHTISNLQAGDLRFLRWSNSYTHITDEQSPLSMAGDTLFHSHWAAVEQTRIIDRTEARGLSYENPIRTESGPVIIRRMQACPDFNPATHWTTCGLTLFDDGRYWNGPGWWTYWDSLDPPTPSRRAYSEGILPRYTYVAGELVIVQGNGGELMVFRHSGRQ